MYSQPGRYVPPANPQGLAHTLNRPMPWAQFTHLSNAPNHSNVIFHPTQWDQSNQGLAEEAPRHGMGPPIQDQYPNLVPLPRPGGPVDLGLLQGGRSGGFAGIQGRYQQPTEERMAQLMQGLRQRFPTPIQQRVPPGQAHMDALQAAHMQAIQHMTRFQHQRRASGRRSY